MDQVLEVPGFLRGYFIRGRRVKLVHLNKPLVLFSSSHRGVHTQRLL